MKQASFFNVLLPTMAKYMLSCRYAFGIGGVEAGSAGGAVTDPVPLVPGIL